MSLEKFEILIASLPDREELVAEIYYVHDQWVEISQEPGVEQPIIQFYPPSDKKYWEFPLEDALEALQLAKKKFLDMGGKRI